MATKLIKPLKRELFSADRKGRRLIVELLPGDVLSFRPKGKRKSFEIYLGHCYALAQIMTLQKEYEEKMKEYQQKKKAGARNLRKPKKVSLPFSKVYFDALK